MKRFSRSFSKATEVKSENDAEVATREKSPLFQRRPRSELRRTRSIRNLGELIQCEICNQTLINARMLACQHTFCLKCLEDDYQTSSNDGQYQCVTCQQIYAIENKDTFQLMPKNMYIDSIFDLLQSSPDTPTALSLEIRCIKCQTVCQFQEQICQHCKQIFCQICWSEHVSELIAKLSNLEKQLDELEIKLNHKLLHFEERCDKLKISVDKAIDDKILELHVKREQILSDLETMNDKSLKASKDLRGKIAETRQSMLKLNIDSVENESQKISIFLDLHSKTSSLIEDVSNWGDVEPSLDRDSLKLDINNDNDLAVKRIRDNESIGVTTSKPKKHRMIEINEDGMSTVIETHYKTYPYEAKLFWNKCPRPAGTGIPPWNKDCLYIATTENKVVLEFDRTKSKIVGRLSSEKMACPSGIAFSSKRKETYISDRWNHCIHVFQHNSNYSRALGSPEKSERTFRSPEGLAMGHEEEKLYVCDTGNDRVLALSPIDGSILQIIGMMGNKTQLNLPTALAFHENHIYVADSGNHRIKMFDVDGNKIFEIGTKGIEKGQVRSPEAVAVDARGFIIVGDSANCRIQIFRADGTVIRILGENGKGYGQFQWISGITISDENELIVTDSKSKSLQIF